MYTAIPSSKGGKNERGFVAAIMDCIIASCFGLCSVLLLWWMTLWMKVPKDSGAVHVMSFGSGYVELSYTIALMSCLMMRAAVSTTRFLSSFSLLHLSVYHLSSKGGTWHASWGERGGYFSSEMTSLPLFPLTCMPCPSQVLFPVFTSVTCLPWNVTNYSDTMWLMQDLLHNNSPGLVGVPFLWETPDVLWLRNPGKP